MKMLLLKMLGVAHGLFGLMTLVALPFFLTSEIAAQYTFAQLVVTTVAAPVCASLLFVCAWKAWHLAPDAYVFALRALAVYVLQHSLSSDPNWFMHLIPAFYIGVAVRLVAGLALWSLARPTLAQSGNG